MAEIEQPNRRWYRLTPDRVVLGLLAAEGFLLLSERFRWFACNQHKGWTVLVALATVGLALLLMFLWFAAALIFRCRFQYSLRSLLLFVVAVAVPFSWLATQMQRARRQAEAVRVLGPAHDRGAYYDYMVLWDPDRNELTVAADTEPPTLGWVEELLGPDFFRDVVCVGILTEFALDERLRSLDDLPALKYLSIIADLPVADAAIEHIKALTDLRRLVLECAGVTDAGLDHLNRLNRLKSLSLPGSHLTDAGLKRLGGLRGLEILDLSGTAVTDAGLRHLKTFVRLQRLELSDTHVTDSGLVNLEGLRNLRFLDLQNTRITDAGLAHLTGLIQLQELWLCGTPVTDAGLEPLKGLKQLTRLNLDDSKVTDEGVKKLQRALPKCRIDHELTDAIPR